MLKTTIIHFQFPGIAAKICARKQENVDASTKIESANEKE